MPFADPVTYEDNTSGPGDSNINHFCVVLGANAASATAPSNGTGEFDSTLTSGG